MEVERGLIFMKKSFVLAVAIALVFALSACGTKEQAAPASTPPAGNSTPAAGGAAADVKLVAKNFEFDQKEYKVKKGQTVNISLENKEGIHGIEIKGLKVKLDNNAKTATFNADKEGSYDIICTIPCGAGHVNMKAKLIVEA